MEIENLILDEPFETESSGPGIMWFCEELETAEYGKKKKCCKKFKKRKNGRYCKNCPKI